MARVEVQPEVLEEAVAWVKAREAGRRDVPPALVVTGTADGRSIVLGALQEAAGGTFFAPAAPAHPYASACSLVAAIAGGAAPTPAALKEASAARRPPLGLASARHRLFEHVASLVAQALGDRRATVAIRDLTQISEDDVDLLCYLARGASVAAPSAAEVDLAPVRASFVFGVDLASLADDHVRSVINQLFEEGVARRVGVDRGGASDDLATRHIDAPVDITVAARTARAGLALREACHFFDIASQGGPRLATPELLLDYGEVLLALGRHEKAQRTLEMAADALDGTKEDPLLDRVAILLATAHREAGADDLADEALRGRLTLKAKASPTVLVAAAQARLAVGLGDEALEIVTKALADLPLGSHAERARALLAEAACRADLGEDDRATEAYLKAHDEARLAGDPGLIGEVANARALFARTKGDHGRAADLYREAVSAWAAAGELSSSATTLENLSRALRTLDRPGEARPLLAAALAVRVRLGQRDEAEAIRREFARIGDPAQDAAMRADALVALPSGDVKHELVNLYTLQEVSRVLALERDSQRVLNLIMDHAIRLLGAERGFLLLKTEEARAKDEVGFDDLVFEVARQMDQEEIRAPRKMLSSSIALEVLRTGRPVLTEDASADERWRAHESVADLGLRSVLCIPFVVRGTCLGAVYLDNPSARRAFNKGDQRLLEAFADQAAVAIENAWLFEENQKKQRELERLNRNLVETVESQSTEIQGLMAQLEVTREALHTRFDYEAIVGRSSRMKEVFRLLDKVIPTDVPVLIQGESGTGKELVAKAIHFNGPRKAKVFIGENCAAITDQLLESELFGHVKGAFTGADRDKPGIFERATKGTVFLDEVGDMSPKMQKELLRVLEEHEVRRVGGKEVIPVDVRLVSATNRDLQSLVETGDFRRDLYYRLNVFTVHLPPLRERKDDIPLLIDHFLEHASKEEGKKALKVHADAMKALVAYHWPGNIRELRNVIDRARTLATGDLIVLDDLGYLEGDAGKGGAAPSSLFFLQFQDAKDQFCKDYLLALLERNQGHVTNAARESGMLRQSFHRLLRRYDIDPNSYRD